MLEFRLQPVRPSPTQPPPTNRQQTANKPQTTCNLQYHPIQVPASSHPFKPLSPPEGGTPTPESELSPIILASPLCACRPQPNPRLRSKHSSSLHHFPPSTTYSYSYSCSCSCSQSKTPAHPLFFRFICVLSCSFVVSYLPAASPHRLLPTTSP